MRNIVPANSCRRPIINPSFSHCSQHPRVFSAKPPRIRFNLVGAISPEVCDRARLWLRHLLKPFSHRSRQKVSYARPDDDYECDSRARLGPYSTSLKSASRRKDVLMSKTVDYRAARETSCPVERSIVMRAKWQRSDHLASKVSGQILSSGR